MIWKPSIVTDVTRKVQNFLNHLNEWWSIKLNPAYASVHGDISKFHNTGQFPLKFSIEYVKLMFSMAQLFILSQEL